jgi:hypothetical protein
MGAGLFSATHSFALLGSWWMIGVSAISLVALVPLFGRERWKQIALSGLCMAQIVVLGGAGSHAAFHHWWPLLGWILLSLSTAALVMLIHLNPFRVKIRP